MFLFDSQGGFGQVPLTLSILRCIFHQSNLLVSKFSSISSLSVIQDYDLLKQKCAKIVLFPKGGTTRQVRGQQQC